ncbi:MAG: GNAT family N-acetyltransferase, partial [Candidatus Kapaibacterium sp.]
TKMGVYEHARNQGIGKELIVAAIEKAKEMGFSELVLYSNRKLENAIHLYRKMGFTELSCYDDLYERCDIQMEMSLI